MQAAQATLRQSEPSQVILVGCVDASRTGYAEAKVHYWRIRDENQLMQAAQATVQGKSKRLPQGRKYLNALKNRTNGTNYENAKHPAEGGVFCCQAIRSS